MKRNLAVILALTFVGVFAVNNCAQSRTNRIYRPCPNTAVTARVEVQSDGDIDLVPCVGRSVLINGLPTSNTITFSGSSRTSFFPVFSTETNLAKSPFGWDGSAYTWDNATLDSALPMVFRPGPTGGFFLGADPDDVEDNGLSFDFNKGEVNLFATDSITMQANTSISFATTEEIWVGQGADHWHVNALGGIRGNSFTVELGDVLANGNQTRLNINDALRTISLTARAVLIGGSASNTGFQVNDQNSRFIFSHGGNAAEVQFTGVNSFAFLRTITTGGTTGNRTIDQPSGTVNFAAAATALTVTNSTVNANSIVLAVTRTNDATCAVRNVVPAAGSFVINMTAACTAETSVGFLVLN